jgi:Flp pilus assembly pilin Flp
MFIPFLGQEDAYPGDDDQNLRRLPQCRRGATALEYLVCISTILVVVILVVQHLGSVVNGKFVNNAKATSETIQQGP